MNLFKRKRKDRVAVFSIDGIPYTFVQKMAAKGVMPNLAELYQTGKMQRMNSVYPTISSVAWSSYMTGVNPGQHNIFGFIDREPKPLDMYIPTSRAMKTRTLWEYLSAANKKVVVINVPVTYPPRQVNGVLIAGFLATKVEKCAYPESIAPKLKKWGYRIDADAWLGRSDKEKFMEDLTYTLEKRVYVSKQLMQSEEWDYFHLHIMESDRISHFLWEHWETGDPVWAPRFEGFFSEIDRALGDFRNNLPDGTRLVVMSDHGFCSVKKEVFINKWLTDNGFLKFENNKPQSLSEMTPESLAYSLIPGRIFINQKGREWAGSVEPGAEYNELRNRIREEIISMTDPDSGEKIVDKVFFREEIYKGNYLRRAADVIVIPKDGFDFKGNLFAEDLTYKGQLVGMHTYDDATLYIDGLDLIDDGIDIIDVLPTIFDLMKVDVPSIVEGKNLLR